MKKILVVDDDPTLCELVRAILGNVGYAVQWTEDAVGAISLLVDGNRYDLILIDVSLPGATSGVQLAHAIRTMAPALTLAYLTGVPDGPEDHGLPAFFKPFEPHELVAFVNSLIGGPDGDRKAP